jgi:nitroimidazol reductase NimA-like FMN-containing flavoprotein (pyridoxamine 5'-phosphate oxidase superfamily)
VSDEQIRDRLRNLLHGQPLGVLATCDREGVHATLVAFASTDDLREIVFATDRATRKFRMLEESPRVAMLVDDRTNEVSDFRDACAVTAHGETAEVESGRLNELREIYLRKHPHLEAFVSAPTCALVRMKVEKYDLVGNFQDVHELRIEDGEEQV